MYQKRLRLIEESESISSDVVDADEAFENLDKVIEESWNVINKESIKK
jgi:hypothetical protein